MNKKTRSKQGVGATLVAIGILLCYVNTAGAVPILVSQGLDAAAYTSSSDLTASFTAVKAFDGDLNNTKWVANGTPVQWIEVDLGKPCDLGYIELTAEGTRDSVNHEIWVSSSPIGNDTTGATLINTVTGSQTPYVVRSAMLTELTDRRYVQVRTTALSPDGYVAWKEIQVYKGLPPSATVFVVR